MRGRPKPRDLDRPVLLSLETAIPPNHFYRHLERTLDLTFVRHLVADAYGSSGRPAIDRVVFFKLHLIMFFEGLRSERKRIEIASLNLAHRCGCPQGRIGYNLDEPLPDHSSLSKIRARLGLPVFRRFFETVVAQCRLDPDRPPTSYSARKSDQRTRSTDPDATLIKPQGAQACLGYQDHYVVDGGKARIILHALITPGDVMENQPMLDLLRRVMFRWRLRSKRVIADTTYGTINNIRVLEGEEHICAYVPLPDWEQKTAYYGPGQFHYDAAGDV